MKKWFIHCTTDMVGTDSYELVEAETEKEAEDMGQEMAQENYQSYDWEQEQQEEEDSGCEYIEGEHYEYSVEGYNPEKHNDLLYDSELKEDVLLGQGEVKG